MAKINLKKITEAKYGFKSAVWAVKGAEHIRVYTVGNTWLADEYAEGKYVGNICKSSHRSILIGKLSEMLAA
jgi:hypothetical protein